MPVRRAKACVDCRRAKAGCSLSSPCSRCAKRHLECHYPSAPPRPENQWTGFRPIRPAAAFSAKAHTPVPATAPVAPVAAEMAASSCDMLSGEPEMAAVTAAGPSAQIPDLSDYSAFTQFFDLPKSFDTSLANYNFWEMTTPDSLNVMSNTRALGPQLSQRVRSLQQGSLTGKMLLGRLTDYTRMMADAKTLPPFIHSPCSLDSNDDCPPDSPHQCLPEALSVCANLTKMFYSCMQGSQDFVWKQICTHLRQMSEEYGSYDEEKMLQALQAAMVYGMLCSQCTGSVSSDDSAWVVATIEVCL
ncbi:hypothetical protein VN97_g9943 [Penicillium thymicola]|uniref:Zn(2)-C6 fungal-type domain-containing protein n=1 Tax=Penicillium thymicola TaxID=293382 RepID=A0AAI9X486_PENTH|nr:hypothetical protein VN97_g9943 [Penicillium thymicola]